MWISPPLEISLFLNIKEITHPKKIEKKFKAGLNERVTYQHVYMISLKLFRGQSLSSTLDVC